MTARMGCWERVMAAVSCIFLEPPVFLFYISYGIFFVTSQQLYIEKACKVHSLQSSLGKKSLV